MATALVSSAAGLLRAYYPEENANEIRRRVLNSADNINNVNSVYLNLLGSGRLNLFAAFEYNRLKFPVMKITPNPSAGKIEIDFNLVESGNYQISVFDVLGKLYHRECFFAQAKAKLGHRNEAIRILSEYIRQSGSNKAKDILVKIKKRRI